jgi:predicted dehydrogenase
MNTSNQPRRNFIKKATLGTAALALPMSAKSYANIIGANDRVNMAVIGLNGRGKAHIGAIQAVENVKLVGLCDVDSSLFAKSNEAFPETDLSKVKTYTDFRKMLEKKSIDAITVAAPDHWHAHMGVMGMQAGKDVYLEKPACHNAAEGLKLIESQKKEGKVLQIGNQQRSAPTSIQAVQDIKEGIIGEVYFAKCWYSNSRGSIGVGQKVAVPENLDWDLWQGPAPRTEYKDNLVHYNWHWFWNWGTGEANNNGFHELDICRWALGVDIPNKVSSTGGRYHFDDDWEFYDTQMINYEYDGKMITWEGKSCNNFQYYDRGRGTTIHGTNGTILLDRNGYWLYDLNGNLLKETLEAAKSATTNTVGMGNLDILHLQNFVNAINKGEKINSPIEDIYISNLMCHLGNIAQKTESIVEMSSETGKIVNNPAAQKMWGRDYEKGWELSI